MGALRKAGLDEHIRDGYGIPMYARMIHDRDGTTKPIPYGEDNQCIYSVGRRYVNEILLDEGSKYDNITFHFKHKLLRADLDNARLVFENQVLVYTILNASLISPIPRKGGSPR